MDRSRAIAERAGVAPGERGLHLGKDREGDLLRRIGPKVEPHWRMQSGVHRSRDGQAVMGEVRENLLRAFSWAEQAEIGEGPRQQVPEQGPVMHVVVGHHHREAAVIEWNAPRQLGGGCDDQGVGRWKPRRCRECRSRVGDGDVPAKFMGEARQRSGIVAGAKDRESRRWVYDLYEYIGSGGSFGPCRLVLV